MNSLNGPVGRDAFGTARHCGRRVVRRIRLVRRGSGGGGVSYSTPERHLSFYSYGPVLNSTEVVESHARELRPARGILKA